MPESPLLVLTGELRIGFSSLDLESPEPPPSRWEIQAAAKSAMGCGAAASNPTTSIIPPSLGPSLETIADCGGHRLGPQARLLQVLP